MKRLHAIQTVGSLGERSGGPARTVTSLCAALTRTGIDIDLVSGKLSDGDALVLPPTSALQPLFVTRQRDFGRAIDQARAQRPGAPLLLHDNGIWATSNRAVVAAARTRGLRYVISPRGMLEPWALQYHGYRKKLAWWGYQRAALVGAAGLIATAEQERVAIRALLPGVPVAVIANGVECPAVPPPTDPASTSVLFMSRIHPKKNLVGLIDAWAIIAAQPQFAAWRLAIAGPDEGGHLAEVKRHAERRGVAHRIDFIGPVGDGDKAAVFARSALFILPSFSENFGNVVTEALAAGLPVIATYGAPWRELRERRAGWWVEPAPVPLADALAEALSLPPAERRAMGERGHAWVASAFGWDRIASDTAAYYRWIMEGGKPPVFVDAGRAQSIQADVLPQRGARAAEQGLIAAQRTDAAVVVARLHVIQTVGNLGERSGGPARTVTSLCAALTRTGIDVDLISGKPGDGDALVLPPMTALQPLFVNGQREFGRAIDIARARSPGTPLLLHDNGIWATSNRDVVAAARARGLRYVISPHGMLEPWALKYHAYRKKLAWWGYQRAALAGAAGLLATAEQERIAIRAILPRVPIAVIANGVDCAAVAPPTYAASTTVLFMSRIHPKKNLIGLIDGWAVIAAQPQFATWRLAIAGPDEGGHLAEVMRHAERRGVRSRVDFLGPIGDKDKAALFARSALFILPSFSENFGNVVIEALAAGLPVIATYGAPWSELRERRAGWWVEPAPAPLADALAEALSLSPAERRAMGERGHAWVAGAFGWPRIAADTTAFYHWVMVGGKPPEFVDA